VSSEGSSSLEDAIAASSTSTRPRELTHSTSGDSMKTRVQKEMAALPHRKKKSFRKQKSYSSLDSVLWKTSTTATTTQKPSKLSP